MIVIGINLLPSGCQNPLPERTTETSEEPKIRYPAAPDNSSVERYEKEIADAVGAFEWEARASKPVLNGGWRLGLGSLMALAALPAMIGSCLTGSGWWLLIPPGGIL